jgi:hypothetical protein
MGEREVQDVSSLAFNEGYRAEAIAKALSKGVKLPASPAVRRPSS